MDKITNTIAYIIILFTLFNFFYGFTSHIQGFAMWHWYLIILSVTIGALLFIKVKRMKLEQELADIAKKQESIRLRFQQKDNLQQLYQCSDEQFLQIMMDLYKLDGIEEIERCDDVVKNGYHFIYWHEGTKSVVKWFKNRPLPANLLEVNDLIESNGEQVMLSDVREFLGVARDYNVQADEVIVYTTSSYSDEVLDFASRNNITLIDGETLIQRIRNQQYNE